MRKDIQKRMEEAKKRKIFYLSGGTFALILFAIAIGFIVYTNVNTRKFRGFRKHRNCKSF